MKTTSVVKLLAYRLDCGRSWVCVLIGSNQRQWIWYLFLFR